MEQIEILREELHAALEKGDQKEILTVSRKLDRLINQHTKKLMESKAKPAKAIICDAAQIRRLCS